MPPWPLPSTRRSTRRAPGGIPTTPRWRVESPAGSARRAARTGALALARVQRLVLRALGHGAVAEPAPDRRRHVALPRGREPRREEACVQRAHQIVQLLEQAHAL